MIYNDFFGDGRKLTLRDRWRIYRKDLRRTYSHFGLWACVVNVAVDIDVFGVLWRSRRLFKRIRRRLFDRVDIVKCRHLSPSEWHDTSTVMPHAMFECLDRFIERDMGNTDWDSDETALSAMGETITFRQARKELLDLQSWWHNVYLNADDNNQIHELDGNASAFSFKPCQFDEDGDATAYEFIDELTPEERAARDDVHDRTHEYEKTMEEYLIRRMQRLCLLHPVMWS